MVEKKRENEVGEKPLLQEHGKRDRGSLALKAIERWFSVNVFLY